MKKQNFDDLVEEAINNIRDDRQKTNELLGDLIVYIGGGPDRHKEVGFTLAKYLETLQRSNEQLVKISAITKKTDDFDSELSETERDSIFDKLNNTIIKTEATPKAKAKKVQK